MPEANKKCPYLEVRILETTIKELKYALYLGRHPFKGFWEIKHEKEGSLKTAVILLILALITQILSALFTGFLFGSYYSIVNYNFLDTVFRFLAIYFAWCTANWCLTCLSDGEGSYKDICIATAYALVPYIIIQFILIILGNFFVLREAVFYNMLNNLSLVWCGFLLVIGMLVTHQYTLARTIVVCIFTIVGMVAMAYLAILFFNLIQQVLGFVTIFIDEIILRLNY